MKRTPKLNVAVFDQRAVQLKLTRRKGDEVVPSNTKIARRLDVSHTTVGRARQGKPISADLIAKIRQHFVLMYEDVVIDG